MRNDRVAHLPHANPRANGVGPLGRSGTPLLSDSPKRLHWQYPLCVVRFAARGRSARSAGSLVRVNRGAGRGLRPLVFWLPDQAESWLDRRYARLAARGRSWRDVLYVDALGRTGWEALVARESLTDDDVLGQRPAGGAA